MTYIQNKNIKYNIVANYVGKAWSFLSIYLFVPIYVRILGVESFGVIAFYSTALGLLFFLEAGLSTAFAREAARERDHKILAQLLVSIERILFGVLLFASTILLLAFYIFRSDLVEKEILINKKELLDNAFIMLIAIVPQIASSLYNGGLMGLQNHVLLNALSIAFNFVRSGLVIIPLYLFRDVSAFFVWQAFIGWMYIIILRVIIMRKLSFAYFHIGTFSLEPLYKIRSFAVGMLAISFISSLNINIDRLFVSALRPISELSYYFLAASFAQISVLVATPLVASILPRLTELISINRNDDAVLLYEKTSFIISLIASYYAGMIFLFGEKFLGLWIGEMILPENIHLVLNMLTLSGLFLSLQLMPFNLGLANGHNSTNLKIGFYSLLFGIPALFALTYWSGIVGASIPPLIINIVSFLYISVKLNRRFNPGRLRNWLFFRVFLPILISFISIVIGYLIAHSFAKHHLQFMTIILSACFLTCAYILLREKYKWLAA
jgi:O-antigen/teichoic acid export membrane protein